MAYENKKLEEFNEYIRFRKVAVIGLGVSNIPLLDYLYEKKAIVTVFDNKTIDDIPKEILDVLKNKEIELELRFCKRRETAYSIYELAKYLGKRVICTSDMYLPLATIKEILDKNGFTNIDKIYLSYDETTKK